MVKICPNCYNKNSNHADFCINCSSSLENAQILEEKEIDSQIDSHYKYEAKESRYISNVWRPFSILGIFFAVISFFFNVLYVFTGLALFFGGIGLVRGDKLGIVGILLAIIILLLQLNVI